MLRLVQDHEELRGLPTSEGREHVAQPNVIYPATCYRTVLLQQIDTFSARYNINLSYAHNNSESHLEAGLRSCAA